MDSDQHTRGRQRHRDRMSDSDEEKGEQNTPPTPVGFFSNSLSHVRAEVFVLWARTSQYSMGLPAMKKTLKSGSNHSLRFHPYCFIHVLGCTIPC